MLGRFRPDVANLFAELGSFKNVGLGEVPGDLPDTGNGFIGGNNGKLGVPGWKSPYNTPNEGAELYEVFATGT